MFKFWLIKETMPLWITLALIAALVVGCVVWGFIESLRDKFRKKPNEKLSD
jgi:peptidoglycan/LPS O-acetylase OafA/YrhL